MGTRLVKIIFNECGAQKSDSANGQRIMVRSTQKTFIGCKDWEVWDMVEGWIAMGGDRIDNGILVESGLEDPRTAGPSHPRPRQPPNRKKMPIRPEFDDYEYSSGTTPVLLIVASMSN